MGRWYEIARDNESQSEWMAECTTASYTKKDNGDIAVTNRAWYWYFFFSYFSIDGTARCQTGGKCFVNFNPFGQEDMDGATNYNVIATDYNSYAVVYSCNPSWLGLAINQNAWIMSRSETMDSAQYDTLVSTLSTAMPNYDTANLIKTTQGGTCKYE